jgi:hypothetical protein
MRAEMARQRKTTEGLGLVLGVSTATAARKCKGDSDWRPHELTTAAEWMERPVSQFLPPGYTIERVPVMVLVGPAEEVA